MRSSKRSVCRCHILGEVALKFIYGAVLLLNHGLTRTGTSRNTSSTAFLTLGLVTYCYSVAVVVMALHSQSGREKRRAICHMKE
ncbi:hypothetical protein SKAU_G00323680 [Synaphobranchus kaupii]|uniref:Uncharacterized protein n=1 Tax=Synaphobranchus kaupii TaxID=118154 RepID=A0A9Q1EP63_SYNKA|nr:hypothetical protein SKAU_G00323680 [Synaphobranchus kaupii]